tara:strand:- start:381 stop:770 length:390 start_codon:yes stop_codon:yes gene_type:complete
MTHIKSKVKMMKFVRQIISGFCLIVFFLVFGMFNQELEALSIDKNDKLISRISKDFSSKFCNGISFGLSEESAMNFAIKENIATFKKKGIENIDNKLIVEKMGTEVVNKCGYSLNLSDDEWAYNFEKTD